MDTQRFTSKNLWHITALYEYFASNKSNFQCLKDFCERYHDLLSVNKHSLKGILSDDEIKSDFKLFKQALELNTDDKNSLKGIFSDDEIKSAFKLFKQMLELNTDDKKAYKDFIKNNTSEIDKLYELLNRTALKADEKVTNYKCNRCLAVTNGVVGLVMGAVASTALINI